MEESIERKGKFITILTCIFLQCLLVKDWDSTNFFCSPRAEPYSLPPQLMDLSDSGRDSYIPVWGKFFGGNFHDSHHISTIIIKHILNSWWSSILGLCRNKITPDWDYYYYRDKRHLNPVLFSPLIISVIVLKFKTFDYYLSIYQFMFLSSWNNFTVLFW